MFDRVTRNPWVRFAAFLLALLVAIWLVYLIRDIVLPFVLALVVAYVLDPLVDFLEARKMSRSFAIFTLIAVLVLALLAVALITVPPLIRQANEKLPLLAENAEKLIDKGLEMARDLRRKPAAPPAPEEQPPPPGTDEPAEKPTPAPAEPAPPAEPEPEADDAQEILSGAVRELVTKLQSHVSTIAQTVATGIAAAIGKIFSTFLAIFNLVVFAVVTVYLLKDIDNLREWAVDMLPARHKDAITDFASEIDLNVRAFFRGQLVVSLILAAIYAIGLTIVGVPFGLLIGVVAGLANIVPYLGVAIGLLPAVVLAAVEHCDLLHPILAVLVFSGAQTLEGTVITPRVVGDKVGLHPVAIILAIMLFGKFLGFLGILFAVPIAAVIKVVLQRVVRRYKASELYTGEPSPPSPSPS